MTADPPPRVSVLLPVYNDERFLPETLRSILGQTFEDFEVVAIDDGSTDQSAELLRSSAIGDSRVRYHRNETNLGLIRSLNRGLALCRGEFIARIDGDDLCEPDRLDAQVRHLDAHPEQLGCASWTTEIDEQGTPIGAIEPPGDPDYVRWTLCHTNRLYHSTMTLRARLFERFGDYSMEFFCGEDYELWCRVVGEGGRIGVVERRLVRYRRRAGSISSRNAESQRRFGRTISTRLISRLLGRPIPEETVGALRALMSVAPIDPVEATPERIIPALGLIAELRRTLLRGASPASRSAADAEIASRLVAKGRALRDSRPGLAARLGFRSAGLPGHRRAGLRLVASAARGAARRHRSRSRPSGPDGESPHVLAPEPNTDAAP